MCDIFTWRSLLNSNGHKWPCIDITQWLLIRVPVERFPYCVYVSSALPTQEVYPLFVKSLYLIDVPLWLKVKKKVVDHLLNPHVKHKVSLCVL